MAYYCDIAEEYAATSSGIVSSPQLVLAETALTASDVVQGFTDVLVETAVLDDGLIGRRGMLVSETALLSGGVDMSTTSTDIVGETAVLDDGTGARATDTLAETAQLSSQASGVAFTLVAESAPIDDGLAVSTHFTTTLGEVALLTSAASLPLTGLLGETAALSGSAQAVTRAASLVGEDAVLVSDVNSSNRFFAVFDEAATFASGVVAQVFSVATTGGELFAESEATAPGGGIAWAAHTETFGMSRLSEFPFLSMTSVDGVLYGVREDGVYRIDQPTDNGAPVKASLTTGLLDFGSSQKKRVSGLYLGYRSEGDLGLTVSTTDAAGDEQSETYLMEPREASAPRNTRVLVGKGLAGRYWRFHIENDGGDFEIYDTQIDVATSARRV